MKRFILVFIFILLALSTGNIAQQRGKGSFQGSISGKVIEDNTGNPIEYANVVLYSSKDSTMTTGGVTDSNGKFLLAKVRPGNYYMDVQFMGYHTKTIDNITMTPSNPSVNLGDILIEQTAVNLGDVVVEAKKAPISYQIDKKVIDVEQFSTAISGTAADVLENVPSITVDIEGNVSLRGSGSFTVLIDGRPTILDAQDALQQIPAGTIDNIEIITNPSAKYNPEGAAGIINIIMKKNKNLGLSGMVNGNAGLNDKYGGELLFEYKTPDYNTSFQIDYNDRNYPGSDKEINRYIQDGTVSHINSSGSTGRGRDRFGLRGSIDLNLGSNNFLNFGGRYRYRVFQRNATLNYLEWTEPETVPSAYADRNHRERSGYSYSLGMNTLHKFDTEGHELSTEFSYEHDNSKELTISELFNNQAINEGRKTTEDGPSDEYNSRINYVLPFSETNRFEAGFQGETEISEEATGLFEYNTGMSDYEFLDQFAHDVRYNENEYALYSLYLGELENFGYQLGLRGEYTYRTVELLKDNEKFTIDRMDYFPTIHTSYKFPGGQQLMASYTRRIDRPRGWQLEPFETWIDPNSVRIGNPSLLPEYIDSYEFGFQTFIADISLSTELYYRVNHNKIERVRSVYAENVTLHTTKNVGTDYSLGNELLVNFNVADVWDVNLMGSMYDYRVEGVLYDEPFSRKSFNWRTRMNNSVKIGENTQVQLNATYNSPSISAQGRREEFIAADLAVKQDLFEKQLSITLQVRDLLNTAKFEFVSEGPDFYSYNYFDRESPVVMLNIRYRINNFRQKNTDRDGGDNGGMDGGGEEF